MLTNGCNERDGNCIARYKNGYVEVVEMGFPHVPGFFLGVEFKSESRSSGKLK